MDPLTVSRPPAPTPVVYDSPHSGRYYPPEWNTRATRDQLRLGEDAYVDELLNSSVALGATLLVSNYPRCYIDVNREETDIDPALLSDQWRGELKPTEKSRRGLGLIRRFVIPGVEVNESLLSSREIVERIESIYRPYHATLASLLDDTRERFGRVFHVNWHSMKSRGNAMTPDGADAVRPDFVVSDGRGTTSGSNLLDAVVSTLEALGYSVSVNEPYRGGEIVKKFGRPQRGVHSVQIETNRALYLHEQAVEKNERFARLASDIDSLTSALVAYEFAS